MARWRCCCCPADGESRDPGRALEAHWETCPGIRNTDTEETS